MKSVDADRLIVEFAGLVGAKRILVVGSQAVHAFYRDPPIDVVVTSREIDLVPLPYSDFEKWFYYAHEHLGADSQFDTANGIYVDMVRDTTPKLPVGWESRSIERTLRSATGKKIAVVYPDVHDLIASKLIAGRPQDREFFQGVDKLIPIDRALLKRRLEAIELRGDQERTRQRALEALD